jgi:hypothetical protein
MMLLPAKMRLRKTVAHEGLGEEAHADPAPAVADQLEHVGLLRHLAGGVDNDGERPAIGQQAEAVIVAPGEPDLVQQIVGRRRVEGGVSL